MRKKSEKRLETRRSSRGSWPPLGVLWQTTGSPTQRSTQRISNKHALSTILPHHLHLNSPRCLRSSSTSNFQEPQGSKGEQPFQSEKMKTRQEKERRKREGKKRGKEERERREGKKRGKEERERREGKREPKRENKRGHTIRDGALK
jgi:hypothetical protein